MFMKKILLLFVSFVAFCSCDNEELDFTVPAEVQNEATIDSFYVSFEEALTHAEKVLGGETATRASVAKRKVANHHVYVANKSTRAVGDDVDVRFHVINFENNQGFALISADSRTTPVYAYSETGNLDIEDATENTGFGDFMDAATEYYIAEIGLGSGDPLLPTDPNNPTLPITPVPTNPIQQLPIVELDGVNYYVDRDDIELQNPGGVLVDVKWNQYWPYNYYCDHNEDAKFYSGFRDAAGCGPVAAGQIMTYFRYPQSYRDLSFDWNLILSSPYYDERYTSYEWCADGAKATAMLLKEIGESADTNYGTSSGTAIEKIYDMFIDFGYLCEGPSSFSSEKVKSSLNMNEPVYMRGTNNGSGHSWVIDSYKQWKAVITYYHSYEPYALAFTNTIMYDVFYHCNWGYGPNSNYENMWLLDVFEGYSNNKRIIYNIRPNI